MSGRGRIVQAALLVLLAVVAFLPALNNGPIEDDRPLLDHRLAGVHSLADLPPLLAQSYWGDLFAGGLWRPLTLVMLGLERLAFGGHLWAYRLVNLLLHAVVTLGVWRLANCLFREQSVSVNTKPTPVPTWGPWFAAAAFAVHPIHAEAVATVYGQADLWAAAFAITALGVAVATPAGERLSIGRTVAIAGSFGLSLGFKESAVAWPLAVVWLRWGGRWRVPGVVWAMLGVLAGYFVMRGWVLRGDWLPGVTAGGDGVGGRFVAVVIALATDFRLMLLPWGQTIYYGHLRDRLLAGGTLEGAAVLAVLMLVHRLWSRIGPTGRARAMRAGWVILGVGLLPVAQVVPIGILVAERTLYLPSIGVCLLIAALISEAAWRVRPTRLAGVSMLAISIGLCWRVAGQWRDERSVWESTLAAHPRSARAIAEVVRRRLDDPAVANTPDAWPALHRMLDEADRITSDAFTVALARQELAAIEGNPSAAAYYAERAERLRPPAPMHDASR